MPSHSSVFFPTVYIVFVIASALIMPSKVCYIVDIYDYVYIVIEKSFWSTSCTYDVLYTQLGMITKKCITTNSQL